MIRRRENEREEASSAFRVLPLSGEVAVQLVGVGATDGRLVLVKPLAERDPSARGVV
jgi:hypothetical protein